MTTKEEVKLVFATIAEEEGLFDDIALSLTKEAFLMSLTDHKQVVLPTSSDVGRSTNKRWLWVYSSRHRNMSLKENSFKRY
jgi:hypothetical protein